MSESSLFPSDTCVLVCSGPSLKLVDPFELGLPVVVVSTGIRVIQNPHYWILADHLNEMHGQEGNVAYQNENVIKILPKGKILGHNTDVIRNYQEFDYTESDRYITDINNHVFSGKLPFVKGPHKSVTFAIQYLHYVGVKNVIWVGNDLHANSAAQKYAYESTAVDLRKSYNYNVTIDQVHKQLKDWYPIIKNRGFNWYSWRCGSVFESFVPAFDRDSYNAPSDSSFFVGASNSQFEVATTKATKVIPAKVSKEERRKLREFRKNNVLNVVKTTSIEAESITPVVPHPPIIPKIAEKPKGPTYSKIKSGDVGTLNKRIRDSLR
jgi:hypothetical protein